MKIMKDLRLRVVWRVGSVTCGNVREKSREDNSQSVFIPTSTSPILPLLGSSLPLSSPPKGSQDSGSPRVKSQAAKRQDEDALKGSFLFCSIRALGKNRCESRGGVLDVLI